VIYTYPYPPKISYREFVNHYRLRDVWQNEDSNHLFLYLHIPFCQQQCSYCDSFTKIGAQPDLVDTYLKSMEIQAKTFINMFESMKKSLHCDHVAIGGGSPSILNSSQLHRTLDLIETIFQTSLNKSDLSIELNAHCTAEFLEILLERNTNRISMGVQSFLEKDLKRLYRLTPPEQIQESLDLIMSMGFPRLNLDLIYGITDQSIENFLQSIERGISYEPTEFYLYPLYKGSKIVLGEFSEDIRMKLYHAGRQRLIDAGYHQDSMRRFVKSQKLCTNTSVDFHKYSCNMDSMIGLGCGARSYTKNIHYSEPFAITQPEITRILNNYIQKTPTDFGITSYGIVLSEEDKRRRFILKSLLKVKGLDIDSYRRLFQKEPQEDFSELFHLLESDLIYKNGNFIVLTEFGLSRSDLIGFWLYSQNIIDLMESFEIR